MKTSKLLPSRSTSSRLLITLSLLWTSNLAFSGTIPTVKIEPVVSDALANCTANDRAMNLPRCGYVYNEWGGHQPRITRHADGTIRMLYLTRDDSGNPIWRLMRRDVVSGIWTKEKEGGTTDDVVLLRDPKTDRAHVIAWPNSIPTTYTSPNFTAMTVPGAWQKFNGAAIRHYGNAGISSDGTVCIKVSHEFTQAGTSPPHATATTNTEYSCGKPLIALGGSIGWSWSPERIVHYIGLRHSYDYIFPNPQGLPAGLFGLSTSDIYYTASKNTAGDQSNLPLPFPYIFNGTRLYWTGLSSDTTWFQADTTGPLVPSATDTKAYLTLKLNDGFIDSKGRIFSTAYALNQNLTNSQAQNNFNGYYTTVVTPNGKTNGFKWGSSLNEYGQVRIFEDGKQRLWLLWSAEGTTKSYVWLYQINETSAGFTLGAPTDLSASGFGQHVIFGNIYLASPRGGNDQSQDVDLLFNACKHDYPVTIPAQSSLYDACNSGDASGLSDGRQQVFYSRIHLPD